MTCSRTGGGNPVVRGTKIVLKTVLLALALFSAGSRVPLLRQASAQTASGGDNPSSRHRSASGRDRPDDLRAVPRTHQPLGRGWSLRGADPRRPIRGPRLRDLLDTIRVGRTPCASSRPGSSMARKACASPPAASDRESGNGECSWSPVGSMTGRLDQGPGWRAAPVTARAGGRWRRAGTNASAPQRASATSRVAVSGSRTRKYWLTAHRPVSYDEALTAANVSQVTRCPLRAARVDFQACSFNHSDISRTIVGMSLEPAALANRAVLRTPACLQTGSRHGRETLYFLKDSWRGRRDSSPLAEAEGLGGVPEGGDPVKDRAQRGSWRGRRDSNPRPPA
jgi:hypothetical protein